MNTLRNARFQAVSGMLLMSLGCVPLASADQAGGLPGLAAQVQVLQVQVQTLMTTVNVLQTTINNLQTNNSNLQAALDAETAARIAGDKALQAALATETANRISADKGLDADIAIVLALEINDVNNLRNAVASLQTDIDTLNASTIGDVFVAHGGFNNSLNNNAPQTIVSLKLPAGTYLIHAVVPAINFDSDSQSGECALSTVPSFDGNPKAGDALIFGMPSLTGEQLPLIDAKTFATDTTVSVSCTGFNWGTSQPSIDAIRIRSIH